MNGKSQHVEARFQNTDEFLAVRFPGIKKSWLSEVCRNLKHIRFSGDMQVSFRGTEKSPLTKWTYIQQSGSDPAE